MGVNAGVDGEVLDVFQSKNFLITNRTCILNYKWIKTILRKVVSLSWSSQYLIN